MKSNMVGYIFVFYLMSTQIQVSTYTILMMPVQLHSHITNFVDIARHLIEDGHKVYTVSYDGYREINPNTKIKTIKLPCKNDTICHPESIAAAQASLTNLAIQHKGNIFKYSDIVAKPIEYACTEMLTDETFWKELKTFKFDLVFVDGLVNFRCMYLVPHRLGVPWVTLSDFIDPLIPRLPWLPSFVPHSAWPCTDQMNFLERIQNLIIYLMFHFISLMPPLPAEILLEYSKYGSFNSLEDLESRSLLWLHTHDDAFDFPRPYMPNVINVGGLSTKPGKKLPQEYINYLNSVRNDVVFVSFGSYLVDLPDDIATKLLKAFGNLKENIIWRFNNKNHIPVPENVKLTGWLPQNDLLAHEKVKVFITHCGNNGQYEALYHGKPILAVPIHGDQLTNAAKIKHYRYGLGINLFDFTEEEVTSSIRELLDNPSFRSNIQKASEIFRSNKMQPAARAAYWIEHVLKFGGSHLRSHALEMPLYQYFMLDILLLFTCVFIAILCLSYKIFICLFAYTCKRKTTIKRTKTD